MAQRPSILQLEQVFLEAWPAVESEQDQGLLRRFANGYTKRANCLQAMDPGDATQTDARIDSFCDWAKHRKFFPVFRETPLAHQAIAQHLMKRGWEKVDESVVMVAPLNAQFNVPDRVTFLDPLSDEWMQAQAHLSGYEDAKIDALRQIVERIEHRKIGVHMVNASGKAIAATLLVCVNGVGVYLNVIVDPELRGQGIGKLVMRSSLQAFREMGGSWSSLQVEADNEAAGALYRGLGFEELYRYRYFQPKHSDLAEV